LIQTFLFVQVGRGSCILVAFLRAPCICEIIPSDSSMPTNAEFCF